MVLDVDARAIHLHGPPAGRFFHGSSDNACYQPEYLLWGPDLLCAKLRPSNMGASAGALKEVQPLVAAIREKWPHVEITIRGDSGFCREPIMVGPSLLGRLV